MWPGPLSWAHRRVVFEPGGESAQPDEVHVVTFPDRAALDRYRADPDMKALAGLRADAIHETVFWLGTDRPPFDAAPA